MPLLSETETLNLPPGWYVNEVAGHGVDLRVSAQRRKSVIAIPIAVLALLAGSKAFTSWNVHSQDAVIWTGLAVFLAALALWISLADEVWHLEKNIVVHRVGIGRWGSSRSCRDAKLEIVVRFSTIFSVSYYRLYAVTKEGRHFLMERNQPELQQLARFIAFHTGWQIPSLPPTPV